jgi:hypothetical protein
MEHVVFSAAQDGAGEEFRRVASLEEAVRVVEHLRNDLGITDPSVFALTPVPVAFRTYYRVEVPGFEEAPAPEPANLELPPAELPLVDHVDHLEHLEHLEHIDHIDHIDHVDHVEEVSEGLESDTDFVFDGNADMDVPGILPEAASIPASRQDQDADHSLGYFAR